jgi:hypothetical protein
MPKVGKLKLQVEGTNFTFELHYHDDKGFFAKDFPKDIEQYMRNYYANAKPVNKAETRGELEVQLQQVLEEYFKLTATKSKVIRLRVGVSTQLYLQQTDTEWGGQSFDGSKPYAHFKGIDLSKYNTSFSLHHKIPLAFGLNYEIGFLVEAGGVKKFHRLMTTGQMSPTGEDISEKDVIMEFSEEKMDFLNNLVDALRTLAANLFRVITDEEKMMQLISSNIKMLTNAL